MFMRFMVGQPLTPAESWIVLIVAFALVMLVAGLCGLVIEWAEDRRARRHAKYLDPPVLTPNEITQMRRQALEAIVKAQGLK